MRSFTYISVQRNSADRTWNVVADATTVKAKVLKSFSDSEYETAEAFALVTKKEIWQKAIEPKPSKRKTKVN